MQEILKVLNLYKSYGKVKVLKGVNFSIKKGEIVGLIGVNGSGKSTLIETICGVKNKDSGEIVGIVENCKNIGYMPQSFGCFNDLTVKENLKYFALIYNLNNNRVQEVLNITHLKEKENYLCGNLSGGYRQLVSLAVAILHNPKLLILDEPTSAMDPLFRDSFWKIIKNYLAGGGSVLVTTHYMEEINLCTKLLILSGGKIVYDNFVSEIFKNGKFNSAADLIFAFAKGEKYEV